MRTDRRVYPSRGRVRVRTKKQSPPECAAEGLCFWVARTATISPEVKKGSIHHHNPTSKNLLLFLFGFLFGLFLNCHRHLLLGLTRRVLLKEGTELTQAKRCSAKPSLYFVGQPIIEAQQIVCQEKNDILEFF
jgi:hypothetical protein